MTPILYMWSAMLSGAATFLFTQPVRLVSCRSGIAREAKDPQGSKDCPMHAARHTPALFKKLDHGSIPMPVFPPTVCGP